MEVKGSDVKKSSCDRTRKQNLWLSLGISVMKGNSEHGVGCGRVH
jgi:hypothetical protein